MSNIIAHCAYTLHDGQESILQYTLCVWVCACACMRVWLKVCEMNYGRLWNDACKWMTYCINSDKLYLLLVLFASTEFLVSFSAHSLTMIWPLLEQKPFGYYMMVNYNWCTLVYLSIVVEDCVWVSTRSNDNSFNSFRMKERNWVVDNQQRGKQ